jgi:hypothetical protein
MFWCLSPCPIKCPYGALQFNKQGVCFIDAEICRGQWYTVDRDAPADVVNGRRVLHRNRDLACWECFSEGDGVYSSKCTKGALRKVLHLGGSCCGNCTYGAMVLGKAIDELCPVGAIYRKPEGEDAGRFLVSKHLCSGCQICYDNINCRNHIFKRCHYENTVRMTAYLGPRLRMAQVALGQVRMTPVHGNDAPTTFHLLAVADGSETVMPIAVDEQWTCDLAGQSVDFADSLHLAILSDAREGTYRLMGFNRAGLNLPITTIERPAVFDRKALLPGRARIRTTVGTFEIGYTLQRAD